jgi:MoaA/NifB/PqqE/SkfB family radical SAM enzyme
MADVAFGRGWHDEEHDGVCAFRWMGREAECRVASSSGGASAWLLITAGHAWPAGEWPLLSLTIDGRAVGGRLIRSGFSHYIFRASGSGELNLTLTLDRTFTVAGDPRALGVMVRAVEIVDVDQLEGPLDAEGWYEWEYQEYFPSRWMGAAARLLVPSRSLAAGRFAAVPVCALTEDGTQVMTIAAGEQGLAQLPLLHGWHTYDVALPATRAQVDAIELTFRVNRLLPPARHPSDLRDLGVRVGPLMVHDDARYHEKVRLFFDDAASTRDATEGHPSGVQADESLALPADGPGWHPWEFDDLIPFRWVAREARARIHNRVRCAGRFCSMPIFSMYTDLTQVLTIEAKGKTLARFALLADWNYYSFTLPEPRDSDVNLVFRVNKPAPGADNRPGDPREIAIRVGPFTLHDDDARHVRTGQYYVNAVRNQQEFEEGAVVLESFPLDLGVDLYGKCNIKPPCVYCPWDRMKEMEGADETAAVDDQALERYGDFFRCARSLVNCSFGEPLLHPRFEQVLDLLARYDKVAEISTNGQAFTTANVRALAGRHVQLYVSLDSASAATYARLRNERWQDVLAGLTFLRDARRRANWLPKLNMVFMPMRANLEDLEAYFKLCRMVEASRLVLRPLNYWIKFDIPTDRAGYHFDCEHELLSGDELAEVFRQCDEYSAKYDVEVGNQFDFGLEGAVRPRTGGQP